MMSCSRTCSIPGSDRLAHQKRLAIHGIDPVIGRRTQGTGAGGRHNAWVIAWSCRDRHEHGHQHRGPAASSGPSIIHSWQSLALPGNDLILVQPDDALSLRRKVLRTSRTRSIPSSLPHLTWRVISQQRFYRSEPGERHEGKQQKDRRQAIEALGQPKIGTGMTVQQTTDQQRRQSQQDAAFGMISSAASNRGVTSFSRPRLAASRSSVAVAPRPIGAAQSTSARLRFCCSPPR